MRPLASMPALPRLDTLATTSNSCSALNNESGEIDKFRLSTVGCCIYTTAVVSFADLGEPIRAGTSLPWALALRILAWKFSFISSLKPRS